MPKKAIGKLAWTLERGALSANMHLPSHTVTQKFFTVGIVEYSCLIDSVLVKEPGVGGQIEVRR